VLNWLVGPLLMFSLAWLLLADQPEYRAGLIIVGLARCIAMVLIWSDLACADREATALLVAINSLSQIVAYSLLGWVYLTGLPRLLGLDTQGLDVSLWEVARTVLIFLGIPLAPRPAPVSSASMAVDLQFTPKTKRPVGEPCCEPVVYPEVDRAQAVRMAEIAKALGDPIRLQLVDVLRRHAGHVCVCELLPLFDISQPTLSHHLKKLRDAGIVASEKRGLWAYYYVLPDALGPLVAWLGAGD
jgi:ArsR family transcriptional regulator